MKKFSIPLLNCCYIRNVCCCSSDDEQVFLDREVDSENRCYYLTVTTVPSLHDCYDCRMVAASFDEEGRSLL